MKYFNSMNCLFKLLHIPFFWLLFFNFTVTVSSAQAPGYMGRLAFLKGDFGFMVSNGPTADNKGLDFNDDSLYKGGESGFAFNTKYSLQAGYVISRRTSLLLEYAQSKTGMEGTVITANPLDPSTAFSHDLFYNVTASTYSLGVQWSYLLKRNGLAPMGPFIAITLNHHRAEWNDLEEYGQLFNGLVEYSDLGIDLTYSYWSSSLALGKNRIIGNRFMISAEYRFTVPFAILNSFSEETIQPYPDNSFRTASDLPQYNSKELDNNAFARLTLHEMSFFKVGFGVMLF